MTLPNILTCIRVLLIPVFMVLAYQEGDGFQTAALAVYVIACLTDYVDGKLNFTAESDALIVKGIVALLIRVLSGHTPKEIMDADLYFIERIGLRDHLSPTRSNGLLAMVKQIRMYALAYQMKSQQNN